MVADFLVVLSRVLGDFDVLVGRRSGYIVVYALSTLWVDAASRPRW